MPPLRIRPQKRTNNDYYVYTNPSDMLRDVGHYNPYATSSYVDREVNKRLPNVQRIPYPDRAPLHSDFRDFEHERIDKFYQTIPYKAQTRKPNEEELERRLATGGKSLNQDRIDIEKFYRGDPLSIKERQRLNELLQYKPQELLNQYLNRYEKYLELGGNPESYNFNIPELLKHYGTEQAKQYGRSYIDAHRSEGDYNRRQHEREELKDRLYTQLGNAPLVNAEPSLNNPYRTIMGKYMRADKGNRDVNLTSQNTQNNDLLPLILRKHASPFASSLPSRETNNNKDTSIYANKFGTQYESGFKRHDLTKPKMPTTADNPFWKYIRRENGF